MTSLRILFLILLNCISIIFCGFTQNISKVKVRWELVQGFSSHSFSKDKDNTLWITPDDMTTFRIFFYDGTKDENPADSSYENIYKFLKKKCVAIKKCRCSNYIGSSINSAKLTKLTREQPEVITRIIKKSGNWKTMKASQKDIIMSWFIRYVGQWKLKLKVTVDNFYGETDIIVTDLIYDVKKIESKKLNIISLALPFECEFLPTDTGRVEYPVKTPEGDFRNMIIRKGNFKSFEMVLSPSAKSPLAAAWNGTAYLKTNIGEIKIGKLNIITFNPYYKNK